MKKTVQEWDDLIKISIKEKESQETTEEWKRIKKIKLRK